MQIVHARIDGQTIALAADTDISGVKERIVTAVRDGAGFVDFETFGRRVLSVLVTPSIHVRFEVFEVVDDDIEADFDSSPIDDLDVFGYAD
jgi:regulator of extracellular matrix RemA (YlzA/DUF370 family)